MSDVSNASARLAQASVEAVRAFRRFRIAHMGLHLVEPEQDETPATHEG